MDIHSIFTIYSLRPSSFFLPNITKFSLFYLWGVLSTTTSFCSSFKLRKVFFFFNILIILLCSSSTHLIRICNILFLFWYSIFWSSNIMSLTLLTSSNYFPLQITHWFSLYSLLWRICSYIWHVGITDLYNLYL